MRFMTKALELNQILESVSKYAKSDTVKEDILNLEPMTDLKLIDQSLSEVYDMTTLISRAGLYL